MALPDHRLIANFIAYAALMVPIAAVDIGVLALLIHVGVHYLAANVVGFLIANLLIYFLSRRLIFRQPGAGSLAEFMIFGLIGLVAIGIQEVVLWMVVAQFHLHYLIGKIGAMGITASCEKTPDEHTALPLSRSKCS